MYRKESIQSRNLYLLNQERITYQSQLEIQREKRISINKLKRIFRYLKKGAFRYIKGRLKASVSISKKETNREYTLKEYNLPDVRVAVYMALYGNYDTINEPIYISPQIDYYIFTDLEVPVDSIWKKIDYRDDTFDKLNNRDKNRYFKILPHHFFEKYDYSIYLDSCYQIVTDLMPFICDMGDSFFSLHRFESPFYYDQVNIIWALNRASKESIQKQILKYKQEGMPNDFAYFWNAVLVRKHNHPSCIKLMEDWWEEYITSSSKRDQVSLPYIIWKNHINLNLLHSMGTDIDKNPRLMYKGHLYDDYKNKK